MHDSYGKSRVRLTKVTRGDDRHSIKEVIVAINLTGQFEESYTRGDNSKIIATDSMKNTVYCLASDHPLDSIESFGATLATHFLDTYSHVESATIELTEDLWQRIPVDGYGHRHSFMSQGQEKRTAKVYRSRTESRIQSGIENLVVLKTTDSGFSGFIRDRFTTLPETEDRILATAITATWIFADTSAEVAFNSAYKSVRDTILRIFVEHMSLSVQQTIFAMGEAVLASVPEIDQITVTAPNQHRIPFNLEPFGLENANEIFVVTDEPYGLITATLGRS